MLHKQVDREASYSDNSHGKPGCQPQPRGSQLSSASCRWAGKSRHPPKNEKVYRLMKSTEAKLSLPGNSTKHTVCRVKRSSGPWGLLVWS